MKQTAVEFLEDKYKKLHIPIPKALFDHAKEMEKEQIIEACENTIKSFEIDKDKTGFFAMGGEGYYKQTFEQ